LQQLQDLHKRPVLLGCIAWVVLVVLLP